MTRTVVVWCPDWPVTAAAREAGHPEDVPLAVLDRGRVLACSATARRDGVRRGLRVREAQARCPELVTLPYDPAVDARVFEPVVTLVEELAPGVEIIRPGICAVGARGPSRYYGGSDLAKGELTFAQVLHDRLSDAGFGCVVGIADGPFAAEQAARLAEQAGETVLAFPPGESARCLAPLPIDALREGRLPGQADVDRSDLIDLLRRLGIRTLGAFAALPFSQVVTRFGTVGAAAHRLASGRDDRPLATRRPPPELATSATFEPPLERVDQVAFGIREAAERLVHGLAERDLVCACLRVEIRTEDDEPRGRRWRHPRWFTAADVVDRVRWQLQGTRTTSDGPAEELTSGVVRVDLIPDEVAPTGAYQDGLWGDQAPDERIHRAFTRIQSMLGHEAVVTAVLSGGRAPAERVTLVPWGDDATPARPTDEPWPGHLPPPAPATVLPEPEPVDVLDATGQVVTLDDRYGMSAPCQLLVRNGTEREPVVGWAGPWPVEERWWDPATARRYARFQVACATGNAYVLLHEKGRWWIEARYD
ncbi:DNA polymerase Y family protein [Thermasporomyces composti]|jgi:protein ImuB|uniref:Protein ImuB n=1 Tax=Thermasporomyces composti TaxID=696763 RepID=A0A3D9V8T8_THECX|nr:DNA polymerase Y family protein [Thermasporomyces composti]REF36580.1 protein ImuB [Thermasporomyces composti]